MLQGKWRKRCLILGLFLCAYPIISNGVEGYRQQNQIATYEREMKDANQSDELWEQAIAYNTHSEETEEPTKYETLLNVTETGMMGVLVIPKIGVHLPIYHGTEEMVLAEGVGHMKETALPVGGTGTKCVLTGHRGLPNSKLFTRLDELKQMDRFYIDICNRTLAYQICSIEVITPEQMDILKAEEGEDLVSLVTCTPYGINTHRLVVTGRRIPYQAEERKEEKEQLPSVRERFFILIPFLFLVIVWIRRKK